MHTQSPVAFAISSPTFFGDRPSGPIFGARADDAPTSPPVALKVLNFVSDEFQPCAKSLTERCVEEAERLTSPSPRWDRILELLSSQPRPMAIGMP